MRNQLRVAWFLLAATALVAALVQGPELVGRAAFETNETDMTEGGCDRFPDGLLIIPKICRAKCNILVYGRGNDLAVRVLQHEPNPFP